MAGIRTTGRAANLPSRPLDPVAAFKLLQSALAGDEETPEPGFFTVEQWAEKVGKSPVQTGRLLRKFAAAGKAEWRKYRIRTAGDRTYPVPHYKLEGM
jgi:hypothetical protein